MAMMGSTLQLKDFSSLQQNYGDNGRSEVILDGGGNIYVASCTRSSGTTGVFQQLLVLFKQNNAGSPGCCCIEI